MRLHKWVRWHHKAYAVVLMMLIFGQIFQEPQWSEWQFGLLLLGLLLVVAVLTVFYMVWTLYLLRGMQRSEERLLLKDTMSSQARVYGPVILWLGEIAALAFVVAGIFMLVVDPAGAPPPHGLGRTAIALGGIAFFGLCAAVFMRMIVLLRRVSNQ
jgi:hypothetical protein